jgi:pimeloyl-ACP methyl ester carboxylesterase
MRILAALLMVVAVAACVSTPKADPPGKRIEEANFLTIGGIEQWVTIRGDDDHKPVLLLIHGGPGDVQSPFVSAYSPYEHDFVLVQWDQRGGGKTFGKLGDKTPDLTLERQVADGIELAEALNIRFPKNRVILLGHSWGTIIGTGMVRKRPDLFDAYVGTGQVASWAALVNHQYDVILAAARKAGDAAAVTRLETMGRPDPTDLPRYFSIAPLVRVNQPEADKAWFASLRTMQGVTAADLAQGAQGMNYSGGKLAGTLVHVDLTKTAPSFPIPWFVIHGSEDLNTPLGAARAYFEAMKAPKKDFVVIEGAGHFALATHQAQVVAALNDLLR